MSQKIIKSQVSIVGAGPVGLIAAHLLEKAGISYNLIEKQNHLGAHPAAHLINLRSNEILSEINLFDKVMARTESKEYLRRIFEPKELHYAVHDHFAPSIEEKYKEIQNHTFANYVHLPQNKFVDVLHQNLPNIEKNIHLNTQVLNIQNNSLLNCPEKPYVELQVKDLQQDIKKTYQSDFLIACDGFRSFVRKNQDVHLIGRNSLLNFLNIFFYSKELADKISETGQDAMLHFIYNSDIQCCLVNHTKEDGMFVLQIPVYPPYQNLVDPKLSKQEQNTQAIKIVNNCLDNKFFKLNEQNTKIQNIGFWNLSCMQTENYFKDRVIFAGDSAHSFPPAGGFGMNTGMHDIHNLVSKLKIVYNQNIEDQPKKIESLLKSYHIEMQQYCSEIQNITMQEYKKSLLIAQKLGLSLDNLLSLKNILTKTPIQPSQNIWKKIIKIGSYHLEFDHRKFKKKANLDFLKNTDNLIPMIFYNVDVNFHYTNGYIDKNRRNETDNENIGLLMPHFYLNLGKNFNNQILSTRQISKFIEEENLINTHKNNILYQNPDKIEQLSKKQSKNIHYMIAFYKSDFWNRQSQNKLEKIVRNYEIPPDVIFGIQISQNNTHILPYSKDPNSPFEEHLINKLNNLFQNDNQFILIRQDSHIFTVLEESDESIQ
ncbi:hypothetical protein PPERSA_11501 [Pseudocohnilembus persalinus]|uniref:FAD-binding domain-containing protein n=1 Tax=Pseudocohnilembus persalinus TaxID=266149 RepID=A0A0V0QY70_PSEPJ|nr:hypothetical protein PPERSA_11501 [Pseudocohnilembus persalinus]|eukprot:KRX06856.1 hypothetical protein PPERSA_11501 [Pseudocohnilembus persalinus]